jgi:hypothetical protein
VLQSATVKSQENFREKRLVLLRLKSFTLLAFLLLASLSLISAQETSDKGKKKEKQNNKTKAAEAGKNATAEQVAESAILIYGSRANLNQHC